MVSVEHVKESSCERECQSKGLWLWLAGRRAAPRRSRNVRQDAARAEGVVFRPAPPTVQLSRDSFLGHNDDTNAEGPDDGDQGKVCLPGSLLTIVQELCESRGGRPGLSVLTSLLVSVDVKNY